MSPDQSHTDPELAFDITTSAGRNGLAARHVSVQRDDTLGVEQVETGLDSDE